MHVSNATRRPAWIRVLCLAGILGLTAMSGYAFASQKSDKVFHGIATDMKGVETLAMKAIGDGEENSNLLSSQGMLQRQWRCPPQYSKRVIVEHTMA